MTVVPFQSLISAFVPISEFFTFLQTPYIRKILQTLQILQSYKPYNLTTFRAGCLRAPTRACAPCTREGFRLRAACTICTVCRKIGAPAALLAFHPGLASLRSGEAALRRAPRTRAHVQAVFSSASRVPVKLGGSILEAIRRFAHSVRGQSEVMEWKPCEPSKIKRTHRSRSFGSPRRRSTVLLVLFSPQAVLYVQLADRDPEMLHRGGDGFYSFVIQ